MKLRHLDQTMDIPLPFAIRTATRDTYRSHRQMLTPGTARRYAIAFAMALAFQTGYLQLDKPSYSNEVLG